MSNISQQSPKSLIERILYFFGFVRRQEDVKPITPILGPFYEHHGLQHIVQIKNITPIPPSINQPSFVQLMNINSKEIAFLGADIQNPQNLLGKFMRINKMAIPKTARLVNPDVLWKIVKDDDPDNKAIDLSTQGLFYDGEMAEGVLLNISGTIRDTHFHKLHFHPCHNKSQALALEKSESGSLTCHEEVTSPSDDDTQELGRIMHKQVIFHIGPEELNKPRGCYYSPGVLPPQQNETIAEMIKLYFTDNHYPEINAEQIDWDSNKKLEGGIFLIPMSLPDDQVVYYCLLNIPGLSNRNRPIKFNLRGWLNTLKDYNENPDRSKLWLDIAGNDFSYLYLDEWSVCLSKNAVLVSGAMSDMLNDEVLASRVDA